MNSNEIWPDDAKQMMIMWSKEKVLGRLGRETRIHRFEGRAMGRASQSGVWTKRPVTSGRQGANAWPFRGFVKWCMGSTKVVTDGVVSNDRCQQCGGEGSAFHRL